MKAEIDRRNRKKNQNLTDFTQDHEEDDKDPFAYNRLPHFERSVTFGFEQDRLGRLNEINREQVQEVLRGSHYANFRHTN